MFILSTSKDDMSKIFQKFKSCLDHSSKNAWTIFGQLNSCIIQFLISFFPKKKKGESSRLMYYQKAHKNNRDLWNKIPFTRQHKVQDKEWQRQCRNENLKVHEN